VCHMTCLQGLHVSRGVSDLSQRTPLSLCQAWCLHARAARAVERRRVSLPRVLNLKVPRIPWGSPCPTTQGCRTVLSPRDLTPIS
jgi:hypothetical protein